MGLQMKEAEYVSLARISFEKLSWDVFHLINIHDKVMSLQYTRQQRREKADILLRSIFLFVTACWESYVEDLCREAGLWLLRKSAKGKIWIGSVLKSQTDQLIKAFNTPNSRNIDDLYQATIGLVKLTDGWKWDGTTPEQARSTLGSYIVTRGEIAHRTRTSTPISKSASENYFEFIRTVVAKTERRVQTYVEDNSGKGFGKNTGDSPIGH